jgi:hypothetical protein
MKKTDTKKSHATVPLRNGRKVGGMGGRRKRKKIAEQLRNRWEDGKNKTGDGRILRRWWINYR